MRVRRTMLTIATAVTLGGMAMSTAVGAASPTVYEPTPPAPSTTPTTPAPTTPAPTTPTTPATTSPPVPAAPTGTQVVVDEFSVVSVTVPSSWTQVRSETRTTDDGEQLAQLVATPDIAAFGDGDAPGIAIFAFATAKDATTLMENLGVPCTTSGVRAAWSNISFRGLRATETGCGTAATGTMEVIAAIAADGSSSAVVVVAAPTPADYTHVAPILSSLAPAPTAAP